MHQGMRTHRDMRVGALRVHRVYRVYALRVRADGSALRVRADPCASGLQTRCTRSAHTGTAHA